MDFKRATALFADPHFDGDPVQVYEPKPGESPIPPEEQSEAKPPLDAGIPQHPEAAPLSAVGEPKPKYVVDDVEVSIVSERVQYLDANGKLITESLKDYTRKVVRNTFASLNAFLNAWNDADRKQAVIDELATHGVFLDELAEQFGRDLDAFDLICHVAYDQPTRTRRERADKVRTRNAFGKYGNKARAVLVALLDKYADAGLKSVESLEILKVDPLTKFGTPVEIVHFFGGKQNYLSAIQELETQLYQEAA